MASALCFIAGKFLEVRSIDSKIRVIAIFAGKAIEQCPNLGQDNLCGIYEEPLGLSNLSYGNQSVHRVTIRSKGVSSESLGLGRDSL